MSHSYHIYFYAPKAHLNTIKQAMYAAGAGTIGDYSQCCWQTMGQGEFMPNQKAKPFLGKPDEISQEVEYKVEMICKDNCINEVIHAFKENHPYEEPAYGVFKLEKF